MVVESFERASDAVDPAAIGCDASVQFSAHYLPHRGAPEGSVLNRDFKGTVADYRDVAVYKATRPHPGWKQFRGVMPGWDNTPRNQDRSLILEHSSPGAFQAWLQAAIEDTKLESQGEERLVFVNAWNEWAEGAYLEPDERSGHGFLEAIRNARDADGLIGPTPENGL